MGLVKEQQVPLYDLSMVKRGDLLWGRHRTWNEGKAGFVTSATEEQLIVQYHPGIGNVTNHFRIPVSEAVDGQWEIRWSADMAEIYEYGGVPDQEPEGSGDTEQTTNSGETDETEPPEETEGAGETGEAEPPEGERGDGSDSGRTDP